MARRSRQPKYVLPPMIGVVSFLAFNLALRSQPAGSGTKSGVTPPMTIPSVPNTSGANPLVPAAAIQSPLDQPLAWIHEAKKNMTYAQDYQCVLVSRERVNGKLLDENAIQLKVRSEPFSVSMRWLAPRSMANQEAVYVASKGNQKMRVRGHGLTKVAGFVNVDIDDPRVLKQSRHTIVEAGLQHLIDLTIKHWEAERPLNGTRVKISEFEFDKRRCYRIETVRLERRPEFYCYRSVLYIDKESKIPVRTENYDWPRPGGPSDGDLLESFSFVSLRFNLNLRDADFRR